MKPMHCSNPRADVLFLQTPFDPYAENPLFEPHVSLDDTGRLLDEYGNAVGVRVAALMLLTLAPTLPNDPAHHVANLFTQYGL